MALTQPAVVGKQTKDDDDDDPKKNHPPDDSIRDLFIPKRWRSLTFQPLKGSLNHTIPKKVTIAELPGFFLCFIISQYLKKKKRSLSNSPSSKKGHVNSLAELVVDTKKQFEENHSSAPHIHLGGRNGSWTPAVVVVCGCGCGCGFRV